MLAGQWDEWVRLNSCRVHQSSSSGRWTTWPNHASNAVRRASAERRAEASRPALCSALPRAADEASNSYSTSSWSACGLADGSTRAIIDTLGSPCSGSAVLTVYRIGGISVEGGLVPDGCKRGLAAVRQAFSGLLRLSGGLCLGTDIQLHAVQE